HNPYGFSVWMAGGGVKGGQIVGATDEFGMHAIERKVHIHSLHATILAAIGIDHSEMTYKLQGRSERATMNEGEVISEVFAKAGLPPLIVSLAPHCGERAGVRGFSSASDDGFRIVVS